MAVLLTRGDGDGPATVPETLEGGSGAPSRLATPAGASREVPSAAVRDPFRYADPPAAAATAPVQVRPSASAPASTSPPPPVRLVGFVRKEGRLKVALAVSGEVVVVGPGEDAGGYAVLAIDEEAGVRLRTPGGAELTLPPPS